MSFALNPSSSPRAAIAIQRLKAIAHLGEDAEALFASLSDVQSLPAGAELVTERDTMERPRYLLSGWAAKVRWLPDGRRQIFNFMVPGEGLGVCMRPNPLALSTVVALTPLQYIDAGPVQRAILSDDDRWNDLREAIHVASSLGEAYLLSQIMRLGRQTAYERLCHLLLEIRDRLMLVGMASETHFVMPLTQETLADATGLSIVHVNRILQQLRRERLLELQAGKAHLRDPATLAAIADYKAPQPSEAADRFRH